jgi:hypothetical protein
VPEQRTARWWRGGGAAGDLRHGARDPSGALTDARQRQQVGIAEPFDA